MGSGLGGLEVFGGRGPASAGIEKVFFPFLSENIIGNLVFLESDRVADAPATVSQIKLAGRAVADRARVIFLAQRLHHGRPDEVGINFPQKFLDHSLALRITAFAEVAEAEVSVFVKQVFGGPVTIGKRLPDFTVAIDYDGVGEPEFAD